MNVKKIWEELTRFFPLVPYLILIILCEIKDAELGIFFSILALINLFVKIAREGKLGVANFSLLEITFLASFTTFIFLSFFLSEETVKLIFYIWGAGFITLFLFFEIRKRR